MIKRSIKKAVSTVLVAATLASATAFPALADETDASVSIDMSEEDQEALNAMMMLFFKMMMLQPVEEQEGGVTYTGAGSTVTFADKALSDLTCLVDMTDDETSTHLVILSDTLSSGLGDGLFGSSEEAEETTTTEETPTTHALILASQPYDPAEGTNYIEALKETLTDSFLPEGTSPVDMETVEFGKDGIDYNLCSFSQAVEADGATASYFGYAAEYLQDGIRYVVALSGSGITPSITFDDFKASLGGHDTIGATASTRSDLDMTPFIDDALLDQTEIKSLVDSFNGKTSGEVAE